MTFHTKTNTWITNKRVSITLFLYILIIAGLFLFRFSSGYPLLYGEESYAHLSSIQNVQEGHSSLWQLTIFEMFLSLLLTFIPQSLLFLVAPILGIGSFLMFIQLTKSNEFDTLTATYWGILMCITPAFILNFTTLSIYSFILFLVLLGCIFLQSKNKNIKLLSVPIFALVGASEIISAILLMIILFTFLFTKKETIQEKSTTIWQKIIVPILQKENISITLGILSTFIGILYSYITHTLHLVAFTQTIQQILRDGISDFGAISGISIFIFILAITGLFYAYKQRQILYLFVIILIPVYVYNTHSIFLLSILLCYAAALALARLTKRAWQIPNLKTITLFILALGILFSSITFIERASFYSPSFETIQIFEWLDDYDSTSNTLVLTLAQNTHFVTYATSLSTFDNSLFTLEQNNLSSQSIIEIETKNVNSEIFSLAYPHLLFPMLDENNVRYIHIGPIAKTLLTQDQGIRFALRNENFKMIQTSENHEIWEYSPGSSN